MPAKPTDDPASEPGATRRVLRAWRMPLVVLIIGALTVGFTWYRDQDGRADEGVVRTSEDVSGESFSSSFRVPYARVDVSTTVGKDTGSGSSTVRAPRGGQLLEVEWTASPTPVLPSEQAPTLPTATLWVRAGGERHLVSRTVELDRPIGTTSSEERPRRVFAVPGNTRDIVAELRFAERHQSVTMSTGERTLGSFAPLYRPRLQPARSVPARSGREVKDGLEWYSQLDGVAERQPYLPELGWAPAGQEWLVVTQVGLRVQSVRSARSEDDKRESFSYEPRLSESTVRLTADRGRHVRTEGERLERGLVGGANYRASRVVFAVPAEGVTTVRVTARLPLTPGRFESDAPQRDEPLVVTRSLQIEAPVEPAADR